MDKDMKERIQKLIDVMNSNAKDAEKSHLEYERILELFALNYDPEVLPLIKELIEMEKDFWYA